ncbi:MAG: DUF1599 domain-containing protein [Odoribacteraceae bacterium]|jgi:hypothetical protein|nr:DUF1599 domain-containing protein [Odoribacteraceae bacterium]
MLDTSQEYDSVTDACQDVFMKKMGDYGTSWRVLRPASVTDQIYIKANRVRSIEQKGVSKVDEGVVPELIGIVNYAIIGLIQLTMDDREHIADEEAVEAYRERFREAKRLMMDKNHDYDEAWREMRLSSFTDLILMKIRRVKQIEDHAGVAFVSEGIDANYLDIINYAVFGLIRLLVERESPKIT